VIGGQATSSLLSLAAVAMKLNSVAHSQAALGSHCRAILLLCGCV
jgi:hypothetical protein